MLHGRSGLLLVGSELMYALGMPRAAGGPRSVHEQRTSYIYKFAFSRDVFWLMCSGCANPATSMIGATRVLGQRVLSGIQDTLQIYQCYLGTPGKVRLRMPGGLRLLTQRAHIAVTRRSSYRCNLLSLRCPMEPKASRLEPDQPRREHLSMKHPVRCYHPRVRESIRTQDVNVTGTTYRGTRVILPIMQCLVPVYPAGSFALRGSLSCLMEVSWSCRSTYP